MKFLIYEQSSDRGVKSCEYKAKRTAEPALFASEFFLIPKRKTDFDPQRGVYLIIK